VGAVNRSHALVGVVICTTLLVTACEREMREFDPGPEGAQVGRSRSDVARVAHYERNAHALATGKRLWAWYNCSGCHGNGGGGASGPALMDEVWIYGWDAASIYKSIADGRPNGMPAYRGRIPEDELWQLTAYVRSLSGLAPQDGAPNRDDGFLTRTPESFSDEQKPRSAQPSAARGQR
jgi:cytochrome c oxidase cbb3-type subunit 3